MIPTVLVAGLVVGRLWFVPVAAIFWGAAILALNATLDPVLFSGASLFAAANASVGVAAHVACRRALSAATARLRG